MIPIIDSGAPVTVTSGSGAFGSWTTIWTPPVSLDCLFVMVANAPNTSAQVGYFDVGVGATPSSILPNGYDIYNNDPTNYLIYPMKFPAGVPISVRAEETGGTAGSLAVLMYGYRIGQSPYPVCAISQILAPSGGNNNFGPISATSPGTLYGTTLGIPTRMVCPYIELVGDAGGTNQIDVGLYAGPSSSSLSPILHHIYNNPYEMAQVVVEMALTVSLPPSQEIYLLENSATSATPYGCVRLFY